MINAYESSTHQSEDSLYYVMVITVLGNIVLHGTKGSVASHDNHGVHVASHDKPCEYWEIEVL